MALFIRIILPHFPANSYNHHVTLNYSPLRKRCKIWRCVNYRITMGHLNIGSVGRLIPNVAVINYLPTNTPGSWNRKWFLFSTFWKFLGCGCDCQVSHRLLVGLKHNIRMVLWVFTPLYVHNIRMLVSVPNKSHYVDGAICWQLWLHQAA